MVFENVKIPKEFQKDLNFAFSTLKKAGSTAIYLFGSLAEGRASTFSDIDLAIQGVLPKFF